MKKVIYISLLIIGMISVIFSGFAIQDDILKMLNERDTVVNLTGVVCLLLWWLVVGIGEFYLIKLIIEVLNTK
jgi:hypothetical protein